MDISIQNMNININGYIHPKYVHLQADAGLYSCSLGVFSHRLFPKARANVHVIQGESASLDIQGEIILAQWYQFTNKVIKQPFQNQLTDHPTNKTNQTYLKFGDQQTNKDGNGRMLYHRDCLYLKSSFSGDRLAVQGGAPQQSQHW